MAKWDDLVLAIPPHGGGRHQAPAAVALLETLLGLHEAQLTLLRGLRRDVRPLQEGPFMPGGSTWRPCAPLRPPATNSWSG